ncbi:hypothetical protein D9Q98_008746 [Chlorella vulgaris]|uniref:Uncharacterized protein n=1 Tax=Chlorella vulgaris TaxID=3077 RepID=A0A9D4YU89_CHLVU|nr:hypothetical protein D9Q98_008746 [Chlorella vulgaris]
MSPNGGVRSHLVVFFLALCLVGAAELMVLTWHDLARISEARHAAYEAAVGIAGAAPAAAEVTPKVALMFLIRTDIPTEPLWRLFLDSAAEAVRKATGGGDGSSGSSAWERLFSVYVHPSPAGHRLPPDSLFAGREVEGGVTARWGNHSMIDAERALLQAALADPLNQRFVLLSETCIPVYSGPAVHSQLLSEARSRVNACRNASDPSDDSKRNVWRWPPAMAAVNISKGTWRKSGQWFMLTRRHAEVVVQDEVVDQAFRQHCWVAQDWNERFCVSDEHYVPTLLAWSGMETETTCSSSVTYTEWRGHAPHPTTFTDATAAVLAQLRGGCNGSALEAASVEAVGRLLASDQQQGKDSLPEICSTPSEVGIFEVAHNTCRDANGKFSWKKFFFEAPGSASPHSGSGVAGAPGAGAVTGAAAAAAATPPSAGGQ